MAVVIETDSGWFICHKTYLNSLYRLCKDENSVRKLKCRAIFFDIKTPFLADSKSKKIGDLCIHTETPQHEKNKKKKKCASEKQYSNKEKDIQTFITEGTASLINVAKNLQHLDDSEVTSIEWFENNSKARKAALEVLKCVLNMNFGLHGVNSSEVPIIRKFADDEYLIPPFSSFHLCDINDFFQRVEEKYDLIVIDPPWINKSVKRKKSYCQLKYDHLRNLPIEKITKPGCLIVVWITNSVSTASYVLDELFPKCNVISSAMWHWAKITQKGNFVYPIDSHHKKPYENLLLGRIGYDYNSDIRPVKEIGSKKLIVSVPSSIHSHKPPLIEILKPYLKPNPHCIELFGRYLLPGWTSVGNEVLKLQNVKLFEPFE